MLATATWVSFGWRFAALTNSTVMCGNKAAASACNYRSCSAPPTGWTCLYPQHRCSCSHSHNTHTHTHNNHGGEWNPGVHNGARAHFTGNREHRHGLCRSHSTVRHGIFLHRAHTPSRLCVCFRCLQYRTFCSWASLAQLATGRLTLAASDRRVLLVCVCF